ncbi:MAG: DUF1156 domain-containing protein [Dehalococcoidia bacterium]|nr:MAG: DUF1156 domain-containing protein [Dehalococcoidia bacterium]
MNVKTNKKLIEVALPLEAINEASAREKSIRHGHPSTLHLWWARRPLAAARAVIFAQMVDDPSSHPDLFPTPAKQEKERQRLFKIIEELVQWENTNNETVLQAAREEIWQSWRSTCAENADHPQAKELFNRNILPAFHDPFAGGGALPLEAQRLGLEAYASDLNPVAVLINKAMIEIPPKFAGKPPVNPVARKNMGHSGSWNGAAGLAEDVRYYGKWMRDEAEKRIGHLYPKVEVTAEMAEDRPDLKSLIGQKLTVIAWLWARTVKSPNPAFANIYVPLISSFMLSAKPGKEAYVEPFIEGNNYRFIINMGKPKDRTVVEAGTRLSRGSFKCLLSNVPFDYSYIDNEANANRIGSRLMAVVTEGADGRLYLPPTAEMELLARTAKPIYKPETPSRGTWASNAQGRRYGFATFGDYFTPRQLVALTTLSDLVTETRELIIHEAYNAGLPEDGQRIHSEDRGLTAYADAVATYLALLVNQVANHSSSVCGWNSPNEQMRSVFARQGIAMVWDYAESNPFCNSSGSINNLFDRQIKGFSTLGNTSIGFASQANAIDQIISTGKIVSTDPPYYDNIGYADLSDFFYVWLRRSMRTLYPNLFSTLATPKSDELVAIPYRHASKEKAETFFLNGMKQAIHRLAELAHPAFPTTIYYAFKQSETDDEEGRSSTGWETFLDAVIQANFVLTGTWPMRTEKQGRTTSNDTNALASSIVMVCRPRPKDAKTATRREFISKLKAELPTALTHLQRGNIAPVDLEQAAIGPGMAIYTSYEKVVDAEGSILSVRDALRVINQTLYEVLTEQEGDFDSDTRWALVWFEQFGFAEGEFGIAEQLSKSKNTSVDGMVSAGILNSKSGKVRLFKPSELPADWEPEKDRRLTVWEMTHQLIRSLEAGGEAAAAELVNRLGSKAEVARELAYRLYTVSERKKRSAEAGLYNSLVISWPEILRLALEQRKQTPQQGQMI